MLHGMFETLHDAAQSADSTHLGVERGTRGVRRHRLVLHVAPRVVLGRRLLVPHVAGVACALSPVLGCLLAARREQHEETMISQQVLAADPGPSESMYALPCSLSLR